MSHPFCTDKNNNATIDLDVDENMNEPARMCRLEEVKLQRPVFFQQTKDILDFKLKEEEYEGEDDDCLNSAKNALEVYSQLQVSTVGPKWRNHTNLQALMSSPEQQKQQHDKSTSINVHPGTPSRARSGSGAGDGPGLVDTDSLVHPHSSVHSSSGRSESWTASDFTDAGDAALLRELGTPFFGCDDSALPLEADLGNFETNAEQDKYRELRRRQESIEKIVPNIYGRIRCPSAASGPDDSRSWRSRNFVLASIDNGSTNPGGASVGSKTQNSNENSKEFKEKSARPGQERMGWWNLFEKESNQSSSDDERNTEEKSGNSSTYDVVIGLNPSMNFLQEHNIPGSFLHTSTSQARLLPFLSDRSPYLRHLQIETQAIRFPELPGGEIEPFFCSLAIYHVEGTGPNAPVLSKCGRVTEALHFDIVNDNTVEELCQASLWPYRSTQSSLSDMNFESKGTGCGIFSLSSNVDISKLFAVIVVQKVIGEDYDFENYIKVQRKPSVPSNWSESNKQNIDLSKLRAKAGKHADRLGQFLTPFAFGVVSLQQAIGTGVPTTPSSLMVQTPLFKLAAGLGEKTIIDHIMVMLYPQRGTKGVAEPTKNGKASLLLRYFGHLGLSTVLRKKSKLAPVSHVVDFTGEVQMRRDNVDEDEGSIDAAIISEPAHQAGRALHLEDESNFYALELAQLPLAVNPSAASNDRTDNSCGYHEPSFYSSFSNELLCRPRCIHNCPRRNVVVKVELRKYRLDKKLGQAVVYPPLSSIHNQRRGEYLVPYAFTACAYHVSEPLWLDEMKIKLPLALKGEYAILFSVYNVNVKDKRKTWSGMAKTGTSRAKYFLTSHGKAGSPHKPEEGDFFESYEDASSSLDLLGCALLPLSTPGDPECLISNDMHDVKVKYTAKSATSPNYPLGTLILVPIQSNMSNDSVQDSLSSSASHDSLDLDTSADFSELMTLQIRTISMSSVYAQNKVIAKFFSMKSSLPYNSLVSNGIKLPWLVDKQGIINLLSEGASNLWNDYMKSSLLEVETERRRLFSQINTMPAYVLAPHVLRLLPQLWSSLVLGTGHPSLIWADPSSFTPLRCQSFATLLHIINAVVSYQNSNGFTQLDGCRRWNLTSFGYVLSFLFDEEALFGTRFLESASMYKTPISTGKKPTQKPNRRSRAKKIIDLDALNNDLSNPLQTSVNKVEKEVAQDNFSFDNSKFVIPEEASSMLDGLNLTSSSSNESTLDSLTNNSFMVSASKRRFNTLPAFTSSMACDKSRFRPAFGNQLSSLLEAEDEDDEDAEDDGNNEHNSPEHVGKSGDASIDILPLHDGEMQRSSSRGPVKQMRIPKVSSQTEDVVEDKLSPKLIRSEEEMESAGTAFLDMIGKNLGVLRVNNKDLWGEEQQVGAKHHRKTRSRSSIDWTLPATDDILERQAAMQNHINELNGVSSISEKSKPLSSLSSERSNLSKDSDPQLDILLNHPLLGENEQNTSNESVDLSSKGNIDLKMIILQLSSERYPQLLSFVDRIALLNDVSSGCWWPFAYEVILNLWPAFIVEQSKLQQVGGLPGPNSSNLSPLAYRSLKDASDQSRGQTIGCAPFLFQAIKKSLFLRVNNIRASDLSGKTKLFTIDRDLFRRVEELIIMVTDAVIDSRSFDSYTFHQTCIDVNNSIVRFIRDLFALISPMDVHRLLLVYFSRFISRDGKYWQDRESKIGLRCSWEVFKLRLNAITLLIRYPEFVQINSPLLSKISGWKSSVQSDDSRKYFSKILSSFDDLSMEMFSSSEGPSWNKVEIPPLKPHWLAELATDICLSATEHADQTIQIRGSSMLNELFWLHSKEGKLNGNTPIIASMYVPMIEKVLGHISYLSSFPPESQIRRDILPCIIFIMQSAPVGLLRALWRKLSKLAEGKGSLGEKKFGGFGRQVLQSADSLEDQYTDTSDDNESDASILDVYSLLNLALKTLEYDNGGNSFSEGEETSYQVASWKKDYLEDEERNSEKLKPEVSEGSSTSASRKWHAHDSAVVIVNTSRYIVNEVLHMMKLDGKSARLEHFNESMPSSSVLEQSQSEERLKFSVSDTIVFVRATTSLYLHVLSLKESDTVIVKTLTASVEILKIFGIKVFVAAVGETLQHWMRVILVQCGARRANVRVQALEFLALLLRMSWDSFGSFRRIRVPLLGVQCEVMERIVATAAARQRREQRLSSKPVDETFSNSAAESSLAPLWKTFDRLHHQSVSRNVTFRTALIRLAETMKTLHTAYIAAHALTIVKKVSSSSHLADMAQDIADDVSHRSFASSVSQQVGKQFLGLNERGLVGSLPHNEAVEDAFQNAADVFHPTELPAVRVGWLQKLAEFHSSRHKFAEEAMCRFEIYRTLLQSIRVYDSLWTSQPFLPWVGEDNAMHLLGEGPAGQHSDTFFDDDIPAGDGLDKAESWRRMFYRNANSISMQVGDWNVGGNTNIFYGVSASPEYNSVSPWLLLQEIEEDMIEEVETAGNLFLRAGLEELARKAWSEVSLFYTKCHNYARLSHAYMRLAKLFSTNVPVVQPSNQLELSSRFGRFYRVWFHGSVPDELLGAEFVYRVEDKVMLEEFGHHVCEVLKSLLPTGVSIDLLLDDGRPETYDVFGSTSKKRQQSRPRLGVCQVKVTPLRPLVKPNLIGSLEWFSNRISSKEQQIMEVQSRLLKTVTKGHKRRSSFPRGTISSSSQQSVETRSKETKLTIDNVSSSNAAHGVDSFTFTQPKNRDRRRGAKDWLRSPGDFTVKSLRVTKLQVGLGFPSSVTRQTVLQRTIFYQSPLEAGVEAICSWCAVLFRTISATNGHFVLGTNMDRGIGNAAATVVSDCIHCSRIREIAENLMVPAENLAESDDSSERLNKAEVLEYQKRLARGIVCYLELLHLLIAKNRDILLSIVHQRKRMKAQVPAKDKTHASIQVQRELQRAYVALVASLYPIVVHFIREKTPRWLQAACHDGYFSSNIYRETKIDMAEELFLFQDISIRSSNSSAAPHHHRRESSSMEAATVTSMDMQSLAASNVLHMNSSTLRDYNVHNAANGVTNNTGSQIGDIQSVRSYAASKAHTRSGSVTPSVGTKSSAKHFLSGFTNNN